MSSPAFVTDLAPFAVDIFQPAPADRGDIERLLDAAFGEGRERKRSYAYRSGIERLPHLSLIAKSRKGRIVGTLAGWPVLAGDLRQPAVLLGPLAVEAELRGRGVARRLVEEFLTIMALRGDSLCILVGDPAYYRRFGFVPASPYGLAMPGEDPARLQLYELKAGAAPAAAGEIRRADGRSIVG